MTEADKRTETLLAEIQAAYQTIPANVETLRSCTVDTARAFAGVTEIGESNRGYWIDKFFQSIGMASGQPWCMALVQYVYKFAASCFSLPDPLPFNTAGTLAFAKWAREKGYDVNTFDVNTFDVNTFASVKPGDLLVWQNGKGSTQGHVAIVTACEFKQSSGMYIISTIEGNTSDKSYRDGGTVAPKEYAYSDENINPEKQSSKRFLRTIVSFDKLAAEVAK